MYPVCTPATAQFSRQGGSRRDGAPPSISHPDGCPMNGWSSHAGAGGWDDEPGWLYEITWEWEPVPGQRYPGDEGRLRAVHPPVFAPTVDPPPADPPSWTDDADTRNPDG